MKFLQNKRHAAIAAGAVLIVSAVLVSRSCSSNGVGRPKIGPIVEAVYALGTVKSDRWYNVRFGMNAIVQRIYVVEGRDVAAGAPLVMTDSGAVFHAPFAGTVTSVPFRESEMAPAGQAILTLASQKDMYVRVSLDQESIVRVRKGQQAELSFENLREEKVRGTVESVYPSGNEFIVRLAVGGFPAGALPEMTCDAAIMIRREEKALMIPSASITNGRVTVVRKGSRSTVQAKTRAVDEEWAEVLDGSVLADDRIIMPDSKKRK
jgi:membrane fusion protein, macrolide-specific efflux system